MTYASSPSSEYRLIQLEGVAEVEECLGVAALLDIVPGRRTEAAYVLALPHPGLQLESASALGLSERIYEYLVSLIYNLY